MGNSEYESEYYGAYKGLNRTSLNSNNTLLNSTDGIEPITCKHINRLLESVSGNGMYETRIYKDVFLIGNSPRYRKNERDKGLVFEEKLSGKVKDKYESSVMFADGYNMNTMSCALDNEGENTNLQMAWSNKYRTYDDSIRNGPTQKIDINITRSSDEDDEFNLMASYNNDRIFDGFFYMTRMIRRYLREHIPAMITRQLEDFQD